MIETHSIEQVPLAERHGRAWHLWPIWFSGNAQLATVATGFVGVALGGSPLWMAVAVVLGCAFGTVFMALHAAQGPQLGLPQMIQSRPQFGYQGALLVWIVALITLVGYSAFNQVLAADTMQALAGWGRPWTIGAVGFGALLLAAFGYELIHRTQRLLAALLLAAFAAVTVAACLHPHFAQQLASGPFKWVPFLAQFFAAAAYQLTWAIYVSDYSRYLPPEASVRSTVGWTYLGALIGGTWPMLIGTVAAALSPTLDVAAAVRTAVNLVLPRAGEPFLIAMLLGLVAVTTLNLYSASLTLLSAVDALRPHLRAATGARLAALLALIVTSSALALAASPHFVAQFGDFLAILLYLFTPWTAINLVDFYWVRHGRYSIRDIFDPEGLYGPWNWRGLAAYFGGFAAMIPFMSTGTWRGPVAAALGGADLAMLVGLPVAAVIYLAACRSLDADRERRLLALARESLG